MGRVAIVTGGTSGVGLAVARQLLREDCKVLLMARDEKRGREACDTLFGEISFFRGDVSSVASCRAACECAAALYGGVDILINSAGVYTEGPILDVREEAYLHVMDVNVKGTFFMCQAALPFLMERKGAIVNVASDAGVRGNYFCALYAASKGAVVQFTRSLALEVASMGIRVNCVAPGDLQTPMTLRQVAGAASEAEALREMGALYPMGRIGTAEEAAAVVCFLASSAASFVTGAVWSVDGGITA